MYWDSNDDRSETESDDDLEPLADRNIPLICFQGLKETLVVADATGPVEGLLRRTGRRFSEGVLEIVRPILPKRLEHRAATVFHTIALKEFLQLYPHPKSRTPYCRDNTIGTNTADWSQGARFCSFCRDRLALVTALETSPAVRVVPVRS